MTRKQKLITIIVSVVIGIALLTTAIVAIVLNARKNEQAYTIMTCEAQPKVQFVLNGNDKVMKVVALNDVGYAVSHYVEYVGLKAEDAAQMFVKISTEAGYINPETDGTKVSIDLNGKKKSYNKLKNKITNKVNQFFDTYGIIAGALTTVTEDLKEAILTLKPNSQNLENLSDDELIAKYLKITEILTDGITPHRFTTLFDIYNSRDLDRANNVKETQDLIDEHKAEIENFKVQLQDKNKSEDEKEILSGYITQREGWIASLEQDIADIEENFVNTLYKEYLNPARKNSQTELSQLLTEIQTNINTEKPKLLAHKDTYAKTKVATDAKIAEFRNTLTA